MNKILVATTGYEDRSSVEIVNLGEENPDLICEDLPSVNFINIYAGVFHTKFWRQSQNITRKNSTIPLYLFQSLLRTSAFVEPFYSKTTFKRSEFQYPYKKKT